jgi:hypothetical protein
MNVNIDGHELALSVVGGSLIIVQDGKMRGSINLLDLPVPEAPLILEATP